MQQTFQVVSDVIFSPRQPLLVAAGLDGALTSYSVWATILSGNNWYRDKINFTLRFQPHFYGLWGCIDDDAMQLWASHIGPEHTFDWLHKRTSCSLIGKYGWKGCGKICNLVCSHLRCSSSRNSLRAMIRPTCPIHPSNSYSIRLPKPIICYIF